MGLLLEVLFQILAEIFVEGILVLLMDVVSRAVRLKTWQVKKSFRSFFEFFLYGLIAGGISLLFSPMSVISDNSLRILNLIVSPLSIALAAEFIGRLFEHRKTGKRTRIEHFSNAFAFALAITLVRFFKSV